MNPPPPPSKIMPFTEKCDSRAHVFKHYAKLLLKSALIIYSKISPLLLHVIPSMTSRGKRDQWSLHPLTNDLKPTVRLIHPRPKRLSLPVSIFQFSDCKEGLLHSPNNTDEIPRFWVLLDATKIRRIGSCRYRQSTMPYVIKTKSTNVVNLPAGM